MRVLSFLALLAFIAYAFHAVQAGSISSILKQRMSALQVQKNGEPARFPILISLKKTVETTNYYSISDVEIRTQALVKDLMQTATLTQQPILNHLKGKYNDVTSFWIENIIAVNDADEELVRWLVDRDDVEIVQSNHDFKAELGIRENEETIQSIYEMSNSDVEWGVEYVKAPEVWAKGATGKGITVGIADTGVHLEHPAIFDKYRGNNGNGTLSHDYNWYDAVRTRVASVPPSNDCPYASPYPCDDHYHGTHCTGTITGEVKNPDASTPRHIGVAYDAKWIGCRNMDHGTGRPSLYLGCLQFMLAPTDVNGKNPRPELRPMIVSNSYGCPRSEQCEPNVMKNAVENLKAAGVFMAVAAGNEGSGCSSVEAPPGIYADVFSVGAGSYKSDIITYFSSRGPVKVDGSYRTKPNIVAPGQNVLSSVPPSKYSRLSGTSMATPHIAGVVALLWSGNPRLVRNVDETISILQKTARPMVSYDCQSESGVPNNLYGYGNVDTNEAFKVSQNI